MIEPNYVMSCVCVKVTDGDTVLLDIDLGFKFVHRGQQIRLYGINTPEVNSKFESTRARALKAKAYVKAAVEGKSVNVLFIKNSSTSAAKVEKYGRYLATVFYKNADGVQKNLNTELVELGLAKPYLL